MAMLNNSMLALLGSSIHRDTILAQSLKVLLDRGFIYTDGCYFLASLAEVRTQYKLDDFHDQTAYECFVNSLHVDDYVDEGYLAQMLLFVRALVKLWDKVRPELTLEIVVSKTDYGYSIKFHVVRNGEDYIDYSQVEGFEEALLVVRS